MKVSREKLSLAMLNAGIDTSKRLAEVSGVGTNTISRINGGFEAKVPTVRKLADALGVNPADILEGGN